MNTILNRWQIILKLSEGKKIREIAKELGVSTTTVVRGRQSFSDGSKKIIERIKDKALLKQKI